MARNQKKQQQKVMKKRRKDKARRKAARAASSPTNLLKRARKYPIQQCYAETGWEEIMQTNGMLQVIVTRKQPDTSLLVGVYLLDTLCLGLKNTMGKMDVSMSELNAMMEEMYMTTGYQPISPELAHQLIYGAIDFAAQFDFKPHRDFRDTRHILEKRGTFEEAHDLKFGWEGTGKPCFVQGPYDNARAIIAKLENNPGPGNYKVMLTMHEDGTLYEPDEDEAEDYDDGFEDDDFDDEDDD